MAAGAGLITFDIPELFDARINEIMQQQFTARAREMQVADSLYPIKDSSDWYEKGSTIAGMGDFVQQTAEKQPVQFEDMPSPWTWQIDKLTFLKGTRVSYQAWKFDKKNVIRSIPTFMAKSASNTAQKFLFRPFTQGNTSLVKTPDGANFFSNTHLAPDGTTITSAAGTQGNLMTSATLSATSLDTAREMLRNTVDDSGVIDPFDPEVLLIGPFSNIERVAYEITRNPNTPDGIGSPGSTATGGGNAPNMYKGIRVVVSSYFGGRGATRSAWALLSGKAFIGVRGHWGEKPNVVQSNDENRDPKWIGMYILGVGVIDWRGAVYSAAA